MMGMVIHSFTKTMTFLVKKKKTGKWQPGFIQLIFNIEMNFLPHPIEDDAFETVMAGLKFEK